MDIEYLVNTFGVWGLIAVTAGFLLKYVMLDLRNDNERNYGMAQKLHDRMDRMKEDFNKMTDELKYLQGKVNGKR
tara:strand:- start:211 stop:435 length:225 start_codon:yes stop_codon:yes gene_type:complete